MALLASIVENHRFSRRLFLINQPAVLCTRSADRKAGISKNLQSRITALALLRELNDVLLAVTYLTMTSPVLKSSFERESHDIQNYQIRPIRYAD